MSYFTDNPVPLMILLAAIAVVALLTGTAKGRGVAGVCVMLAVGLYFLEQTLVSPAEEVEGELQAMLQHFKDRDLDAITQQICPASQILIDKAAEGMELVDINETFHVKSVDVTVEPDRKTAEAMLRANGSITVRSGGGGVHAATFWKTIWLHQDGHWLMSEAIRLNPANGQPIEYFSRK